MSDDAEPTVDRADRERSVRSRLEVLDAILIALERRSEVIDVVAESESADEAKASLRVLLGISDLSATANLDLQIRRLAKRERARILEERNRVRREPSH
jgi:DNA gyrase/topoisomerase IV subunit A